MSTTGSRACDAARLPRMARAIDREPTGQGISDEGSAPASQVLARDPNERERGPRGREQRRKAHLNDEWIGQLKKSPSSRPSREQVTEFERGTARHDAVLDLELDDELGPKAGRHYAATLATNRAAVTAVPTTDRTRW